MKALPLDDPEAFELQVDPGSWGKPWRIRRFFKSNGYARAVMTAADFLKGMSYSSAMLYDRTGEMVAEFGPHKAREKGVDLVPHKKFKDFMRGKR